MVAPDSETPHLCSPLAKQHVCTEAPTPGALQQHLFYGEYDPFKYAPIFESDFVQVTKKGEVLNIHNQITVVTVGVTSTSPNFNLPNVMLLARPINALKEMMCNCTVSDDRCPLELTRLFPLSFVNISIHDVYNRRLRLKLANGRAFYLQLYVHPDCENEVFERWMKLVTLLHTTPEDVYGYEAVTPEIECILEQGSLETSIASLSDWQLEPPEMSPGMREYYEASRASSKKSKQSKDSKKSKKSDKSDKNAKPEKTDCSQLRKEGSDDESIPEFDGDQEPWPPVEPPKKEKKNRGKSIGFNFFNKGSKEKLADKHQDGHKGKSAPPPPPPSPQNHDARPKGEREEKGGRKPKDNGGKSKQKDKPPGKEDKGDKEKKKQRDKEEKEKEKAEKQREKEEKRQQQRDRGKPTGSEDAKGKEKEKRQQEKEAKQREKEEKKRRDLEDRKKGKGQEKEKRQKEKKKPGKPASTRSKEKVDE